MEDKIAIFYDIENIVKGYGELANPTNKTLSLEKIIKTIEQKIPNGKIFIQKAYADWITIQKKAKSNSFKIIGSFSEDIIKYNIEQVQVYTLPTSNGVEKDVADLKLAIDVMDTLYTRNSITTFVIVSGDGANISLIRRLKEDCKKVILASYPKSFNKHLKNQYICDDIIYLYDPELEDDELIQFLQMLTEKYGSQKDSLESTNKEILEIFKEIVDNFIQFPNQKLLHTQHTDLLYKIINYIFSKNKINYTRFGFNDINELLKYMLKDTNLAFANCIITNKNYIGNKEYLDPKKLLKNPNKEIKIGNELYRHIIKSNLGKNFSKDQLKNVFDIISTLKINDISIDSIISEIQLRDSFLNSDTIKSIIKLALDISFLKYNMETNTYIKHTNVTNFDTFLNKIKKHLMDILNSTLNKKDIDKNIKMIDLLFSA